MIATSGGYATPGGASGVWSCSASAAWPAGAINWNWECHGPPVTVNVAAVWFPSSGNWRVVILINPLTGEIVEFTSPLGIFFPTRPFTTGDLVLTPTFPSTGSGIVRAYING